MAILIRRSGRQPDPWRLADAAADAAAGAGSPAAAALPPQGDWIVPRAQLGAALCEQPRRSGRLGVLLEPQDDPLELTPLIGALSLVAVRFPQFTDGRGYSAARLLRDQVGWTGELRAVGDVLRDQIWLLSRCGFDSFALREDQDPDDAIRAFDDFSVSYRFRADGR